MNLSFSTDDSLAVFAVLFRFLSVDVQKVGASDTKSLHCYHNCHKIMLSLQQKYKQYDKINIAVGTSIL